jgi:carotenoid cleavage dioxygenase-like enzyme
LTHSKARFRLTFTAYPKVDPFSNALIVYGYEAKGLGTLDIVIYALHETGKVEGLLAQVSLVWIHP